MLVSARLGVASYASTVPFLIEPYVPGIQALGGLLIRVDVLRGSQRMGSASLLAEDSLSGMTGACPLNL